MKICELSLAELKAHRRILIAALQRLKGASAEWDELTARRGHATMGNLQEQIYEIDARLEQLESAA